MFDTIRLIDVYDETILEREKEKERQSQIEVIFYESGPLGSGTSRRNRNFKKARKLTKARFCLYVMTHIVFLVQDLTVQLNF